MSNNDDFRFASHHALIELDAATNHLMMLVVSKEISGPRWVESVQRHRRAYEAWTALLSTSLEPPPSDMIEYSTGSNGSITNQGSV
jgi:hypothetical protein